MVDDLLNNYNLIGIDKNQLFDLLGENDIVMNNDIGIEYVISSGYGDIVGLIFFLEDGIVSGYKISNH